MLRQEITFWTTKTEINIIHQCVPVFGIYLHISGSLHDPYLLCQGSGVILYKVFTLAQILTYHPKQQRTRSLQIKFSSVQKIENRETTQNKKTVDNTDKNLTKQQQHLAYPPLQAVVNIRQQCPTLDTVPLFSYYVSYVHQGQLQMVTQSNLGVYQAKHCLSCGLTPTKNVSISSAVAVPLWLQLILNQ